MLWQPARALPLSDLAGPALLATGHQDPPQHEEGHQGEGAPHTSFPQHQDCLIHLLRRPCSMPYVPEMNHMGELKTGQGERASPGPKPISHPGLSPSLYTFNPSISLMGSTCKPDLKSDHFSKPYRSPLGKASLMSPLHCSPAFCLVPVASLTSLI